MTLNLIYGTKYCPATLADKENTVTCVAADSCEDMENFFRRETVAMGYIPMSAGSTGVWNCTRGSVSKRVCSGIGSSQPLQRNLIYYS